ncbi:hypothetical protein LTS10_003735 [Elasticomyces elasticus]|nr:hypothetical protein LTS10_003735 [Elasticomyces elasticus]
MIASSLERALQPFYLADPECESDLGHTKSVHPATQPLLRHLAPQILRIKTSRMHSTATEANMATKPMATKPSCPFLALPLELRELIYDYVFRDPNTRARYSIKYPSAYTSTLNFGILRANRQIYAEALPRFYKHKIFYAYTSRVNIEAVVEWLGTKPHRVHKHIDVIELRTDKWHGESKTAMRRQAEQEETMLAQGWRAIEEAGIELREGTLKASCGCGSDACYAKLQ